MNKKILLIISLLVIAGLALNFFLFASVSIKTNVANIKGSLDGREKTFPFSGFLRTGNHQLSINIDGYLPINTVLVIHPGQNKEEVNLKTYKESYIEKLPYVTPNFEIEYNRSGNFFYILIKNEPYKTMQSEALKELQKNNINVDTEKIIWDAVAGVNNRVGP